MRRLINNRRIALLGDAAYEHYRRIAR